MTLGAELCVPARLRSRRSSVWLGDLTKKLSVSLSSSLHACLFSRLISEDEGTWRSRMLTSCSPRKRAASATRRRRPGVRAMLTGGRMKQFRSRPVVKEHPGGYPLAAGGPSLRIAKRPIANATPSAISSPFIARQPYSPFHAKNTPKPWRNRRMQQINRWM